MGLFRIFSGKPPEAHETRGDAFMNSGDFGNARIEYEKAINKIDRKYLEKSHLKNCLKQKFDAASEALAGTHMENADALIEIGDLEAARELYLLAFDLTADSGMAKTLSEKLARTDEVDSTEAPADRNAAPDFGPGVAYDEEYDEEEVFSVLCHALPDEVEAAYRNYGEAFRAGYVALNQGDFETAVDEFSAALEENAGSPNLIPLELATACIHLGDAERGLQLLENFISSHPSEPRAYSLLCEILWERGESDRAEKLLEGCPAELKESKTFLLLSGETLYQQGKFSDAETVFQKYFDIHGKDEVASRALAKTMEAAGDTASARDLYAEIINQCTSCRTAVDPFLKRRYAELCFETGQLTPKLLELYLDLARTDLENRPAYYSRIASIYEKHGDFAEARRYQAFAENSG